MFSFSFKKSLSHAMIILCVIISIIGFVMPNFQAMYSFYSNALALGIHNFLMQAILFQFLHGDIIHLLANSYFLYIAGPSIEARMSRNHFLWFFIFTTIIIIVALLLFAEPGSRTLGISGFCSALLAYLCMDLYTTRHPQMYEMLALLSINISIGLLGGISFVGHFFWAVAGLIFWYILKKIGRFF